jgi:hypothetical protein
MESCEDEHFRRREPSRREARVLHRLGAKEEPMITASTRIAALSLIATLAACGASATPGDSGPKAEGVASTETPLIQIGLTFHIDPVDRVEDYSRHREAVLWLTQLARDKGFAISAGMTGLYAEHCVKNGHLDDFKEFMPGGKHVLGTHLHSHYKGAGDRGKDFSWTLDNTHAVERAPEVWGDQIAFVNQIFTGLGHRSKDNHYFNGTQTLAEDMTAAYGAKANENTYDNVFDVIEGRRGVYHPYRSAAEGVDVVNGKEDLSSPFVGVSDVAGLLGTDQPHGPEGMLYGTLPFAQRDFILEYLEWTYHQRHSLASRPWVFGFGFHPYEIAQGVKGSDGRDRRASVVQMYDWLNQRFVGRAASYATHVQIAEEHREWEQQSPGQRLYESDSRGAITLQLRTQVIYDELRGGLYSLQAEHETDRFELYDFSNGKGERRLVLLGKSVADTAPADVSAFVAGLFQVVSLDGRTAGASATAIPLAADAVLLRPASR